MGDKNSFGSFGVEPVTVVADDQIPLVVVQLMLQPLVFIFDGLKDFRNLQQNLWDEQCAFAGVGDAIAMQGNYLECREFPGQQNCYISFGCKVNFPSQFKEVTDQRDAAGSMPQPPVQWGNQCGRSFYLLVSSNEYFLLQFVIIGQLLHF